MDNNIKEDEVIEPEVITEVESIKNNSIATMHNRFVEARYRLTLEEQRIMLALISLIQPEDEDFKDYKIPVNVLQELTGTKRKDIYEAVKEAIERLLRRTIVIETERDFEAFNFISYGRYRKGKGYFIISIDKHLKPYLLKLKEKFTRIPLRYIFLLRSVYSIRLYELLKQYESTGFRVDYLPDLREMLGIEENEYKDWRNFERIVLKRAVKEINEKTDLQVSYKKKKTGRKITHIEFEIKTNPKASNINDEKEIIEKIRKLNQGDTTEIEKSHSESIDTQGQKQEKNFSDEKIQKVKEKVEKDKKEVLEKSKKKPSAMEIVWQNIGELRKHYEKYIDEIRMWERSKVYAKLNKFSDNELLFLFINADKDMFDEDMIVSVIKKAMVNPKLNNPFGFLVKTLNIDMKEAKFKELTITPKKIDEELFKQKLKKMLVEGKSAREYIKPFWDEVIKIAYRNKEITKKDVDLLIEPFRKAVYDDFENKVYIPVFDEFHKVWFEGNYYLDKVKEFLKERFDIEDVELVVLEKDTLKNE